MPPFQELSAELLSSIIDLLHNEPHPSSTLKSLSLVDHRCHDLCSTLLFRHIALPLTENDPERCIAFLDFLHRHTKIRSVIRGITIPLQPFRSIVQDHTSLQKSFEDLLPLLPCLRWIRIGGDQCFNYDWVDMRPVDVSILRMIQGLSQNVHLLIDCYIATLNFDAPLDQLTRIDSLRICLAEKLEMNRPNSSRSPIAPTNLGRKVSDIIYVNPHLKHFHLALQWEWERSDEYMELSDYALWSLGPAIAHCDLESLTLEGDIKIPFPLEKNLISAFNHLTTLSINGIDLVCDMAKVLQGQLPLLRHLYLSAFLTIVEEETLDPSQEMQLREFFSTLNLKSISLLGFSSSLMDHIVQHNGATLATMKHHIREQGMLVSMRGGPALEDLMLQRKTLSTISESCHRLEHFTLDILRKDLLSEKIFDMSNSPLALLMKMRSLRQLRLFLPSTVEETYLPAPSTADILAAYKWIRSQKDGVPVEELVVCLEERGALVRWDVWQLGPRKVGVRHWTGSSWVQEVWDAEEGAMKEKKTCDDGITRSLRPVWLVTEGW